MLWGKIGLVSFGGPAGQITLIHREVVVQRRWINEDDFLNATGLCMLLPGPEAMQLATYLGWRLHGLAGGLWAGLLFILPGALCIALLASLYALYATLPQLAAAFAGIKAAVVVIVIDALLRMAGKALKGPAHWSVASAAFGALLMFEAPFPLVIGGAALAGWLLFPATAQSHAAVSHPSRSWRAFLRTLLVWGGVWSAPVLILALLAPHSFWLDLALFFSQLAVVSFGGAYTVLAYMAQVVVQDYGWLTPLQMTDALGLAETTPGPLILVIEFVSLLAGYQQGGLGAGLMAAFLALWVTFAPCFLWIFLLAPHLHHITGQRHVRSAIAGVMAAVVGVIGYLTVWFGFHVFFDAALLESGVWRVWEGLDGRMCALAVLAGVLLLWRRWNVVTVLGVSALAGVASA